MSALNSDDKTTLCIDYYELTVMGWWLCLFLNCCW